MLKKIETKKYIDSKRDLHLGKKLKKKEQIKLKIDKNLILKKNLKCKIFIEKKNLKFTCKTLSLLHIILFD